jgi:predicted amidohydrolase
VFGGSRVIAPNGSTIAKAKVDAEDWLVVDIDLDAARTERAMSHILSTRNPAAYGALVEAVGS